MADHIDENAETANVKSLDQSAIDEALASMQVEDSEDTAATTEPAAHTNGGETFAAPQSDGHEDLDAAIAALQADESEDDVVVHTEPTQSEKAGQDEIDAALAAMQADATSDEEAADVAPAQSEKAGQDEIDAALAAMQAGATSDEKAADAESAESGEAGRDDVDAIVSDMQADETDAQESAGVESVDSGEIRQDDIDAASADAQADAIPEQELAQNEPVVAEGTGQEDIESTTGAVHLDSNEKVDSGETAENEAEDATKEDINATIAALQEDGSERDITEEGAEEESGDVGREDIDAAIAVMQDDNSVEIAQTQSPSDQDSSASEPGLEVRKVNPGQEPDDINTFSGLDDKDENPSADEIKETPEVIEKITAGAENSQTQAGIEGLPEITARKSDSTSAVAHSGSRRFGKQRFVIAALCLTVLAGSAAYFGRDLYSAYRTQPAPPQVQRSAVETAPAIKAAPPSEAVAVKNPYHEKLKEVSRLRADLLSKKDEIDRLRQFYRDGISELEEELQQEAARQNVRKLSQAVANNKMKLDIQSIQRRWAYIDELAKPYHWLQQGSEELLFLSRRTEIDLKMDTIAAGIELTKHMRRLNASLQTYQLTPERLAIDVSNSRLRPVEEIWQTISSQNKAIAQKAVANGDPAIIDEICSGDTGRIAELTTLTIKASKCLSQLSTSEMFLNRLTFLSPVAAKYLSNWRGQWLCLNGFQEMTPEVARHLFRWEGNWISLNGLEDFNPEVGELLLSWEGHQLELMGLKFKADQPEKIGLQQLSDWERSGGKLFVPDAIRAAMEKMN